MKDSLSRAEEKGSAWITELLKEKRMQGGEVFLPAACYQLSTPVIIDTPCTAIRGEIWGYSADPNGVFEGKYGTKLRLWGQSHPALRVGNCETIGGCRLLELGVQGDLVGMDTRLLFDPAAPTRNAGLIFDNSRTDQCICRRLSFCGLGAGIVACGDAEIDACTFEGINTDGCDVGIWFAPRASYYTKIRSCVVADTPSYGLYLSGGYVRNLDISDMTFVRNGGAFGKINTNPAAVLFDGAYQCILRDSIFDEAGTFWYYPPKATKNEERQITHSAIPSLVVWGDKNVIRSNIFHHCRGDAIQIRGNGNILLQNIADGNVHVEGYGNIISDLIFTAPDQKLFLCGAAAETSLLSGIPDDRIVREG